jgi:hypothetical protein
MRTYVQAARNSTSGASWTVRPSTPARVSQPIQMSASPGTAGRDLSAVPVRVAVDPFAAAREATRGEGAALPYRETIQKSFGRHDISGITAHGDGRSAAATRMMGANAFATGENVAFAGRPSLHTAAHEAAHVVQQRGGLKLPGGLGRSGDAHERHADAVADRVARGQSSEALLDAYASTARTGSPAAPVLQMEKKGTDFGDFEDVYYDKITNTSDEPIGCEMYLRFIPNEKVDADLIGLTQTVKATKEGSLDAVDNTKKSQAVTTGPGKDSYIDQYAGTRNPLYATSTPPAAGADKMENWDTGAKIKEMSAERKAANAAAGKKGVKYDNLGQHGYRKKSGASWISQPAELDDWPTRSGSVGKKDSGQVFETTALALTGTQKGTYYGSVQWGWQRDGTAKFSLVDFKTVSKGALSAGFQAAAKKWNDSQTSAGEKTLALPVP